jgi:ABC-type glutathione transport system ATPase component
MSAVIDIRDLHVSYRTRQGGRKTSVQVIDGLNLQVEAGETLGIVGESGSGKSTLAHSLVGLVTPTAGSIMFDGTELVGLKGKKRLPIQRRMQMVFQNPLLSLSPRLSIGAQLHEPLQVHTDLTSAKRQERIATWLDALELSQSVTDRYPHELSGGQAQRVVLARAMTLEPEVMVFDEPTSALDVSVQAGVLNLLRRLKTEANLTYLFITHDLGVARHLSDRIAVMRSGEIVELRDTSALFEQPDHPYTETLLASSLSV